MSDILAPLHQQPEAIQRAVHAGVLIYTDLEVAHDVDNDPEAMADAFGDVLPPRDELAADLGRIYALAANYEVLKSQLLAYALKLTDRAADSMRATCKCAAADLIDEAEQERTEARAERAHEAWKDAQQETA